MKKEEELIELMKPKMEDGEEVLCCIDGAFSTVIKNKNNVKTGILAATTKKIRFCGKRFFMIYDDVIEYSDILDIDITEEKLGFQVFIKGKDKPYFMKYVINEKVKEFVDIVKDKIKCDCR